MCAASSSQKQDTVTLHKGLEDPTTNAVPFRGPREFREDPVQLLQGDRAVTQGLALLVLELYFYLNVQGHSESDAQ